MPKIIEEICENCKHACFDSFAFQFRCSINELNILVNETDTCIKYEQSKS